MSDVSAAEWVPESPTLSELRSAVQDCRGCELYRDATQGVMGEGPTPAPLMLLGEQPGDREDREGEPFVGPAGGILHEALADAGIEPEATYTTNVVKHFRHRLSGKRRIHQSPTSKQVGACAPWLAAELDLVRPAGIVLLGGTAGKALYGSSFRVGEARGHLLEWPEAIATKTLDPWVLATTHPSAVLRAEDERQATYDGLVADLRVAAAALKKR
ncbi:UdgX family uracil-DNA binding protein [Nocardioides sp. NPDC059952]|uniref:UdgX family uracil-DNA binding protein n=1 Tax=Nocardioides sp. NPDC059952 TaxID=3347014 RepID=UPI003659DA64